MKRPFAKLIPALLAFALVVPTAAEAQFQTSLAAGIITPTGDFGDMYDPGYSVRGQIGVSFLLASVHAQVGVSRFSANENAPVQLTNDNLNVYHYGVGARTGFGLFWVGANAAYFSGDGDDGLGFFPEVGVSFLMLEAVADIRIDGDQKWYGLRAGLRF